MEEYKLLINGKCTNSSNNVTFKKINPATLEKLATFQVPYKADVSYAIKPQLNTFKKWIKTPQPKHTIVPSKSPRILENQCTHSIIHFSPLPVIPGNKSDTGPDNFEAALKRGAS